MIISEGHLFIKTPHVNSGLLLSIFCIMKTPETFPVKCMVDDFSILF